MGFGDRCKVSTGGGCQLVGFLGLGQRLFFPLGFLGFVGLRRTSVARNRCTRANWDQDVGGTNPLLIAAIVGFSPLVFGIDFGIGDRKFAGFAQDGFFTQFANHHLFETLVAFTATFEVLGPILNALFL